MFTLVTNYRGFWEQNVVLAMYCMVWGNNKAYKVAVVVWLIQNQQGVWWIVPGHDKQWLICSCFAFGKEQEG